VAQTVRVGQAALVVKVAWVRVWVQNAPKILGVQDLGATRASPMGFAQDSAMQDSATLSVRKVKPNAA